ncbi:MAG: DUF4469 domain-containing protein [Marinilabiliaceae bacterium]|nr:DUF4469 domain-containing protein [Marinilabiliaceae bacterium]
MNKLNVWLYDNLLTGKPNDFFGKVKSNGILSNQDLVNLIIEEGTELKRETLLAIVNRLDRIKVTKLAQGYAVNSGVCYARVGVNGCFQGALASFDKTAHKVIANFTAGAELRAALQKVEVDVLGVATVNPVIGKVKDSLTGQENSTITPNNVMIIAGDKIKIAGTATGNGVYLIQQSDKRRITCPQVIKNEPKELLVMIPDIPAGEYALEVVTQYSSSRPQLKTARTTLFDHLLLVE